MRRIDGDLILLGKSGHFDVIAHGCNCMNTMGAGLAAAIRAHFPVAHAADHATIPGDRAKLGTCTAAAVTIGAHELHIVNAYTQFHHSGHGVLVDYAAVRTCMQWIRDRHAQRRIGLPLIGAGLAGGDWPTIEAIIADELGHADVTIVSLPARS